MLSLYTQQKHHSLLRLCFNSPPELSQMPVDFEDHFYMTQRPTNNDDDDDDDDDELFLWYG